MKQLPIMFLRATILATGAAALAGCMFALPAMWLAVPVEYPNDSYIFYCILSAAYVVTVPFCLSLYQGMRLLSYIRVGNGLSKESVLALRLISVYTLVISTVFAATIPFFYQWSQREDAPGLVIVGLLLAFVPLVTSVFMSLIHRLFKDALRSRKHGSSVK